MAGMYPPRTHRYLSYVHLQIDNVMTGWLAGLIRSLPVNEDRYFWRLDSSSFIDDVCRWKTRKEAETPVSDSNPNYGVGDCLLIVDGQVLSNNCNFTRGYNVPTALVLNGTSSYIINMNKAGKLPSSVQNAIGSGPNLVSWSSSSNSTYANVPSDDENVNKYSHAANTAVGLIAPSPATDPNFVETLVLVTADGHDGCKYACGRVHVRVRWRGRSIDSRNVARHVCAHRFTDPTCGITAEPMAFFMKDFLKVRFVAERFSEGVSWSHECSRYAAR